MKLCPKCGASHNNNGRYCSRSCANSRTWSEEDKQKKSLSSKATWATKEHPSKGKPGWKHSESDKQKKRDKSLSAWDKKGRRTKEQIAAQNRQNVHNYRARKLKATCPTADLGLIKKIMEACPKQYDVDHIIPLSKGGKHHEDNLQYLYFRENRRKNNRFKYDESLAIPWQDLVED